MMKKLMAVVGGVGCLALQACGSADFEGAGEFADESVGTEEAAVSATMTINNNWGTGYCANVKLTNGLTISANDWKAMIDLKGATVTSLWGAKNNGTANGITSYIPESYTAYIPPAPSTQNFKEWGFCVSKSAAQPVAELKAWNMTSTQYAACSTNNGVNPTRAALAVAMANEMGRWQPQTDLVKNSKVEISATGLARCTGTNANCPNTRAILAQQDSAISTMIPQSLFSPTNFMEDLKASFDRQTNLISNLQRNSPGQLPPAHKLTRVAGPIDLGVGACGPHYVYMVTDPNGVNLTSAQASNLQNALCYYGGGNCGPNPYIGFATTGLPGCPAGKTCIAIDPNDGDNNSGSTTTAGSAPTYPMNRALYSSSLLNTSCITKAGQLGKMKCLSSGCNGYLYCTP